MARVSLLMRYACHPDGASSPVVLVGGIIDCWVYEVLPGREVVVVTYGVERRDREELCVSNEHRRFGLFKLHEIEALPIPEGYRRSIRAWFARSGQHR
jgi:hypothetical protein